MSSMVENRNQAPLPSFMKNSFFIMGSSVIKDEVMRKFYRQQKGHHLPEIESQKPTRRSSFSEMVTDAVKHITPLVFRKSSLQEYHSNTSKQQPW